MIILNLTQIRTLLKKYFTLKKNYEMNHNEREMGGGVTISNLLNYMYIIISIF